MPQGLSNAPATFNRLVTQLFRPHRGYAQTYFDDIFVHSRTTNGRYDKELLAMKYALVKSRVHLLGSKPFVIYTDHASLRTAT